MRRRCHLTASHRPNHRGTSRHTLVAATPRPASRWHHTPPAARATRLVQTPERRAARKRRGVQHEVRRHTTPAQHPPPPSPPRGRLSGQGPAGVTMRRWRAAVRWHTRHTPPASAVRRRRRRVRARARVQRAPVVCAVRAVLGTCRVSVACCRPRQLRVRHPWLPSSTERRHAAVHVACAQHGRVRLNLSLKTALGC